MIQKIPARRDKFPIKISDPVSVGWNRLRPTRHNFPHWNYSRGVATQRETGAIRHEILDPFRAGSESDCHLWPPHSYLEDSSWQWMRQWILFRLHSWNCIIDECVSRWRRRRRRRIIMSLYGSRKVSSSLSLSVCLSLSSREYLISSHFRVSIVWIQQFVFWMELTYQFLMPIVLYRFFGSHWPTSTEPNFQEKSQTKEKRLFQDSQTLGFSGRENLKEIFLLRLGVLETQKQTRRIVDNWPRNWR